MTLEHLVANYGSFGLFVGASLEGEGIAMHGDMDDDDDDDDDEDARNA
mgnify:CR=1 FL=1